MASLCSVAFRYRNVLAGAPLVYALISTRWEWESHWGIWAPAVLLCGVAIALRTWGVCHCGYGRGWRKQLARTGPYAHVRNPLYWANTLLIASAAVASELEWFLPVALSWAFLVYSAAIRHEEGTLRAKYGSDYADYFATVPRWLPHLGRPGQRAVGRDWRPVLIAAASQLPSALLLLPFLLKELVPLALWHA